MIGNISGTQSLVGYGIHFRKSIQCNNKKGIWSNAGFSVQRNCRENTNRIIDNLLSGICKNIGQYKTSKTTGIGHACGRTRMIPGEIRTGNRSCQINHRHGGAAAYFLIGNGVSQWQGKHRHTEWFGRTRTGQSGIRIHRNNRELGCKRSKTIVDGRK